MRLLVDTNIFLEILLEQNCAEETKNLLRKVDQHDFFISDFSLHSVGLLLLRRQRPEVFRQFLSDLISNVGDHTTRAFSVRDGRCHRGRGESPTRFRRCLPVRRSDQTRPGYR